MSSAEVDAVYIPLANSDHYPWSRAALEAGKHVLCEKPIAMHADQILELIAVRDRVGRVCAEAMMIGHHPQWALVEKLLWSGEIGYLLRAEGCFTY